MEASFVGQSGRVPSYRRQREKGRPDRAVVTINGQRHVLGRWGSPESRQRYAELLAKSIAAAEGDDPGEPQEPAGPLTVSQLLVRYLAHCDVYYRTPDGDRTPEYPVIVSAMRILRKTAGPMVAEQFGPRALKQVRDAMVAAGWSRKNINKQVRRVVRLFRWAVSEELLPPVVAQALSTVEGLKAGRTTARETSPVEPVPDDVLCVTLEHMGEVVADMCRVAVLTGARPGELVQMRPADIDRTRDIWLFRPRRHKTQHFEKQRVIPIGPKCQQVLAKYLFSDPCFPYSADSFRRAVQRACVRAKVEPWSPNQLRHNAATMAREVLGLDAAQAMLGHSQAKVTQVYAALSERKAAEVARAIG